ncbi:MAG TPA: aldose epimerase family protein [Bacteroidales bacterium]|nr:aldose epimerase family protein [Bacteroidales bacterium]
MMKHLVLASFVMTLVLTSCTNSNVTLSGLNPKNFRTEIDGKKNDLYVLKNKNGMEVCMTNYGARIVSVWVPDKNGNFADVVLGFDSIGGYLNNKTDFGAFIGRYGNRIAQGKFSLDGKEYQLSQNNFGHCLHGGVKGFQYCMFDIKQLSDTSLEATYVSADNEMGFPGKLTSKATYTLTSNNAIDIRYTATTDKPTVVNLTNHSYFNLTGNPKRDILGHVMSIDADGFTPVDTTVMTTGEISPVCCTPMDFRKPCPIGERINNYDNVQMKNGKGYDHNWVLNTKGNDGAPACFLSEPVSGRTLTVYTNEPGLQVYTGNFLNGSVTGKKGVVYQQRTGICLETQHYPDSPNKPQWPSVVLRPGQTYTSHCIYQFGIMEPAACKNATSDCCKTKTGACQKNEKCSKCAGKE